MTSLRSTDSGGRVQLSQCPQRASASDSSVLHADTSREEDAQKYLAKPNFQNESRSAVYDDVLCKLHLAAFM